MNNKINGVENKSFVLLRDIVYDRENKELTNALKGKKMLNDNEKDEKYTEILKDQIRIRLSKENIFELKVINFLVMSI